MMQRHAGLMRTVAGLAAVSIVATATPVSAAPPPEEVEAPAEVCEDLYAADECSLIAAIELNGVGQEKFEAGDFVGAIVVWEQALVLLPDSKRARLRVPLGNAYREAYNLDHDETHLHQALALFEAHIESLDSSRADERALIEEAIAEIETELARLVAEREEQARQHDAELREQAIRELELEQARKRGKTLVLSGSVLGSLGVVGLGVMAAGLGLGKVQDSELNALPPPASELEADLQPYRVHNQKGRLYNGLAWGTGIAGGVLLLGGITLIVLGRRQHKRAKAGETARLRPHATGLELSF